MPVGMPSRNIVIYCDESLEKGRYFSHFYGGALVLASDRQEVERRLNALKAAHNLHGELKWTKITANYADKYIAFVDEIFDLLQEGLLRMRVMFTQNANRALGLSDEQIQNQYFLLYYQLIKHAFGLMHCGEDGCHSMVTLYLDDVPDSFENLSRFKKYVASLSDFPLFVEQRVTIPESEITDVRSHDHVILQALDVVMGAMQFRLNDKHLDKPAGKFRRAKRTVAKERVYKRINARIREIYPGFNIGVNTGTGGDLTQRWHHAYRHWLFVPSHHENVRGIGKARNQK